MKDFDTSFDALLVNPQTADSDHDEISLNGDLSVGGSKLVIGYDINGAQQALFECLDGLD